MKIMSINAGSSSLKFSLFDMDDEHVIVSGLFERIAIENSGYTIKYNGEKIHEDVELHNHQDAVRILMDKLISLGIIKSLDEIDGIGHRITAGGEKFDKSVIINDDVVNDIIEIKDFAPLHNLHQANAIKAFREVLPNTPMVCVFDTTFHQTMDKEQYIYPTPMRWYRDYKVRKYGAHGTSHYYVSQRTIEYLGHPEHSNVIVCHLGAGASLCAVKDGKSYNTSMGLTPLAGVMMSTRCGDIDASVIDYLDENLHMSIKDITNMLNKKSGLLGVSGVSGDMRDVKAAADEGNERAKLAIDIFIRRVADYIGKYFVQLGKVDAISFTAGIGENAPWVRKLILEAVGQALDIVIDDDANENGKGERLISAPESKVKVYVIPTNEELVIARDAKKILNL